LEAMDGRVLVEALADSKPVPAVRTQELETQSDLGDFTWRQTLRLTTVGKITYLVDGNGGRIPRKP
ncbi:MAG TPA: hypothetical protein VNW28_05805, partial [Chthoniobacterales bacterium]|nr:hypothetical protein [Chthoniobacterales bacterium]